MGLTFQRVGPELQLGAQMRTWWLPRRGVKCLVFPVMR
jgi:hypothetical protein